MNNLGIPTGNTREASPTKHKRWQWKGESQPLKIQSENEFIEDMIREMNSLKI